MDDQKLNQEPENEGEGNKAPAKKTKFAIRNPFYRKEVEASAPADAEDKGNETNEKPSKRSFKERLSDFGKGVGTTLLVLGIGAIAYAKHEQAKEAQYVDVSEGDDDSEENRILPPPSDDDEEEEESKEKESE